MSGGGGSGGAPGHEFKRVLERAMAEAGLSTRSLHDLVQRQAGCDIPENTIDSWRRPHSSTGEPSLPREQTVGLLGQWLCAQPNVTVTEEELLAAWRADRAAQASRRTAKPSVSPPDEPVRLHRGEVYEGIIDASIYLGMDSVLGRVDQRLRELLNAGLPIPTYYAYLTHRGYLNWVNLTEDNRYTYYRAGVELCERHAPEIATAVVGAAGHVNIDIVSLGPGTGAKDRALVQALLGAIASPGGNDSIFYYPYDINPAMIVHAIQTVLSPAESLPGKVFVKGIIAPFDSLGLFSYVYRDRAGCNVLALLGNTLGNMSDDFGFLETVFMSGMMPGDFLLLEVRCHVGGEAGAAPGIGEEAKRRFNFGPLEVMGASYDEHRDSVVVRRERSRSAIPNTVTTVTRCDRVRCGATTWRDVRLAYVHEYSEPDLDRVLGDIGYAVVQKFAGSVGEPRRADLDRGVLLYLLRKG
jgi:hypothetical protein